MSYVPTIGLEIHVQLKTKSKMFCGCDNDADGKAPNSVVCPVCLGMPGVLPAPNRQAIEWAMKLGKYVGGTIAKETKFDRKHYFYPDLPKGYQISQYDEPIIAGGEIKLGEEIVHLERIHMEEDAGKLIHLKNEPYSLVDLNRAGTPLLEIVTKPEIKSPAQAKEFLQRLRLIVRYLGISSANMEKGHLRCDANISLKEEGSSELGTPVEIKNLNSFLMVEKALTYEIKRQRQLLENGEKVIKETRGWDDGKGVTLGQRTKEHAPDYRYFPEPDIPRLTNLEASLELDLPESMESKIDLAHEYGVAQKDIDVIFRDDKLLQTFDKVKSQTKEATVISRVMSIYINMTNARKLETQFVIDLAKAVIGNQVGSQAVKLIIDEGLRNNLSVADVIKTGGFSQISSEDELTNIVKEVITQNKEAADDVRAGKENALQFLVGQVMRQTRGKANPEVVHSILRKEL